MKEHGTAREKGQLQARLIRWDNSGWMRKEVRGALEAQGLMSEAAMQEVAG